MPAETRGFVGAAVHVVSDSLRGGVNVFCRDKRDSLRSTMGKERVEGLVLINVYPTITISKQQVVDKHLRKPKRVLKR